MMSCIQESVEWRIVLVVAIYVESLSVCGLDGHALLRRTKNDNIELLG